MAFLPLLLAIACHADPEAPPGAPADSGGDGYPADRDGDGYPEDRDCNDADATVNPAADERCDGVDDDCDGVADAPDSTWYVDGDGDGYGDPATGADACQPGAGQVADGTDCDDTDPAAHPGAEEACDGDDDDCDGRADVGVVSAWYTDDDGDGYGDPLQLHATCDPEPGWVLDGTDCSPGDPEVHPDAAERCDEVDDDCDGVVDEGIDGADSVCWFSGDYALSTADAALQGATTMDDAGRQLKIGDADGDGVGDLVVATEWVSRDEGGGYVVPGPITGTSTLEAAGWHQSGPSPGSDTGRSVGIGDVNGDGVADLAYGAPFDTAFNGLYVVYGPIVADSSLGAADVVLLGTRGTSAGHGSDIGDVDGDGVADAVVGAYGADYGGVPSGLAWVEYGPLTTDVDLGTEADATLGGEEARACTGRVVEAGADLDGDGIGDIVVASVASIAGPSSGAAYVVYGPPSGDVDLSAADARLVGAAGDYAGLALASGDVNGDGQADAIVGTADSTAGIAAGAACVVYGPVSGDVSLTSADVTVRGTYAWQEAGYGLAAGDIDDDGVAELIVGAPGDDAVATDAGAAYLFRGITAGVWAVTDATAVFWGEAGIAAGQGLAIGDLDADGLGEVVVGAPMDATGGSQAGSVHIWTPPG
jgi:hypothetical protein